ncbi:MAG: HD domain-containing protein [Holophagaceae bacterium]|nr:HD domain-containing protein [Holophagaceae bacterium]
MKIAMDVLSCVFSNALDIIEQEQLGASERHGMRIGALSAAMGKKLGYSDDKLCAVSICAMFHDNALTEYSLAERHGTRNEQNMNLHCEVGQANVSWLPFKTNIDGFILYHHERGNGKGPYRKREGEYPEEAALIAGADIIDATYHLQRLPPSSLDALKAKIDSEAESYSTRTAINALLEVLDKEMLEQLRDDYIYNTIENCLPTWEVDLGDPSVIRIAGFAARVIDYKSQFTHKHTAQIANRAWLMANYCGYSKEDRAAIFLAAGLHDIGKIATPTEVLEKPGRLTDEEFEIIKYHVRHSHDWLGRVPGFENIRNWAANHHEKLDGGGYSFGKQAEELDFNSRLIGCLDIYQAVCEKRPYHEARSHADTMPILYDMAKKGLIDAKIVKDLDEVMADYSLKDVPSPLEDADV